MSCALLTTDVLGQHIQRKPWPMYSLQNMPQTAFSCHDKILGGYYADSETQCQMFHVCVKVAGVGVQDFRFLCPNGTAFDQEAQTCSDWGDVDCEQSVLYYGSDNFDLYRLGSGFESKRAPLAEEEEATFHLQRAESADIRRSKSSRVVDQQSRPDQPPNYTKHYETVTTSRNQFNQNSNLKRTQFSDQKRSDEVYLATPIFEADKRPTVANYYTPTRPTTTTTTKTTKTATEKNFFDHNAELKHSDSDDLFKGSHSSHFFSNRNGGREDEFFETTSKKVRPNDLNDFVKLSEPTVNKNLQSSRGRRVKQQHLQTKDQDSNARNFELKPLDFVVTTSTPQTKITKKLTLQTSFNAASHFNQQLRSTTQSVTPTTTTSTTHRSAFQLANFNHRYDLQTQEKIQPTTFNPLNSSFRYKTTTKTYPEATESNISKGTNNQIFNQQYDVHHINNFNRVPIKTEKFDRLSYKFEQEQISSSTPGSKNEISEFSKISTPSGFQFQGYRKISTSPPHQALEDPKSVKNITEPQTQRSRSSSKQNRFSDIEPQYFRSRPSETYREPAPFSAVKTTTISDFSPKGFFNRRLVNYKSTTQAVTVRGENFTPSENSAKKFSTLVPKDQYAPTTFKPTTYKKSYENVFFQTQTPKASFNLNRASPTTTTTTTTTFAETVDPYYSPDEDDGQYHPELYEVDYSPSRHRDQTQRPSFSTTTFTPSPSTTQKTQSNFYHKAQQQQQQQQHYYHQPTRSDLSDEDEIFNAAHSLNLGAASVNKLRADKLKANKTQIQKQSSSLTVASTTKTLQALAQHTPTARTTFTTTTTKPLHHQHQLLSSQPDTKKSIKVAKSSGKSSKKNTKSSRRPPHADDDTSYDYAYYDSLSETPQEYQDYDVIAEFSKTRKN